MLNRHSNRQHRSTARARRSSTAWCSVAILWCVAAAPLACQTELSDNWSNAVGITDDASPSDGSGLDAGLDGGAGACGRGAFISSGECRPWRTCAEGTFVSEEGTADRDRECEACPSGSYSDTEDSPSCEEWSVCPVGWFVSRAGSASRDQRCERCAEDTTSTVENAGACLPADVCPSGTVQISPAEDDEPAECEPCDSGSFCAGGTSAEHACPDTEWDHDADPATDCIDKTRCAVGSYVADPGDALSDRECEECESGSFSLTTNAESCQEWTSCEPGSFVEASGDAVTDRVCEGCAAGSFTDAANQNECTSWTQCEPGEFVAVEGSSTRDQGCEVCPDGQDSTKVNARTCLEDGACPAGTIQTSPRTDTSDPDCEPCEPGQFCVGGETPAETCRTITWDHDSDPSTACAEHTQCLPGGYIEELGDAVTDRLCTECPDGQFSTDTNVLTCQRWQQCSPGTYVETEGSSTSDVTCVGCPSGSFSSEPNATECAPRTNCQPGEFVRDPGSAESDRVCEECPEGQYSSSINASACLEADACPPGTVTTTPATESAPAECEDCSPGAHCAGGSAPEVSCGGDDWDDDSDPATPCVEKTACVPGQRIEDAGGSTIDRTCIACAPGRYSDQNNQDLCDEWNACEPGTYVAAQGTSTTDRRCDACPNGTFSTDENVSSCVEWSTCVAPDFYQSTAPSSTTDRACTRCDPGQISDDDNETECFTPAFQMSNGQVVMEAENFHARASNGSSDPWEEIDEVSFVSGSKAMRVGSYDNGDSWTGNPTGVAPRLDFNVNFTSTGDFWILIRGDAANNDAATTGDSCWAGVDGTPLSTFHDFPDNWGAWAWVSVGPVDISTTGIHTISLWGREDFFRADKIVVKDNQTLPVEIGPPESPEN